MSIPETPSINAAKLFLVSSSGRDRLPSFHSGEILEGTLVEHLDGGHAVLRIRGQNLLAENRLSLPLGEELRFRVEETGPKVVLRLLAAGDPGNPSIVPLLKRNLSGDFPMEKLMGWMGNLKTTPLTAWPPEIREGIASLLSFFRQFGLNESLLLSPSHMKDILFQSGLFLENKILQLLQGKPLDGAKIRQSDWKSLLLLLKAKVEGFRAQNAEGMDGVRIQNLEQGLDQLLQKIEFYQLMNTNPSDPQDKMFLLIPLGVQTQPQLVEVGIFFPSEEREEEKGGETGLLFLLHFPDWGRMKIEVKVRDRSIFSQFTLTDPKVADFIQVGFPALSARFAEIGYQSHFQVSVQAPEEIESSLFGEMIRESQSLFNIVV